MGTAIIFILSLDYHIVNYIKPFSMSTSTNTDVKSATPKKIARTAVSQQLANTLTDLKEALGEKKFERRIRKAARLLTAGIKGKPVKREKKEKEKKKTKTNKVRKEKAAKALIAVGE